MTAKIFRNAFLIGFTVLLACILLFFFIMYSNYQAQAYDILEVEAEHIAEGMQICGGEEYLAAMQSDERITWIAPDGSVLYDNMADADTMENHLQRPEVQEAFETGSGRSDRYSSTILEKNNYYARLLKDGTVLRVAGKQTSVAAMALMLVQPSLWIVVLVLVLCLIFLFPFTLIALIVGLFFGLRYAFRGPELDKGPLNSAMDKAWSDVRSYDAAGNGWVMPLMLVAMLALSGVGYWRKAVRRRRSQF